MSHSICTHRGRVNSQLLVVESQTANLTPGPSFDHNLCCRYPNGSCEAIFDIYTSKSFQRFKKHLKARCFDPCHQALKFWEFRRAPSSHVWECESHPHTCLKVGLRHWIFAQTNWCVLTQLCQCHLEFQKAKGPPFFLPWLFFFFKKFQLHYKGCRHPPF